MNQQNNNAHHNPQRKSKIFELFIRDKKNQSQGNYLLIYVTKHPNFSIPNPLCCLVTKSLYTQ